MDGCVAVAVAEAVAEAVAVAVAVAEINPSTINTSTIHPSFDVIFFHFGINLDSI